MILWDAENQQLMTPLCRNCPEDYFAPYRPHFEHVGCCSYSPVFSLYELWKMVSSGHREFFINNIYRNPNRTVKEYSVVVHAHVHPEFELYTKECDWRDAEEEFKLSFSICQFFVKGKGCGLDPRFKNGTCRSFICSAVEERLDQKGRVLLQDSARQIRYEVETFNQVHQDALSKKGWNLIDHLPQVLDYLEQL
ncbi:hypothetical protein [Ammoniphilus sp. YIM 78166]|uniref:hypothetical protein n=1 Tax=Ammoniphilus sp. YIM 78166 TaxID=1644106 RepID=UPI00106FFB51|nr:hypothetical protein [Ammoniphilus sp. YIM 78166]